MKEEKKVKINKVEVQMSKINSHSEKLLGNLGNLQSKRNLFSKLQSFTFSNFVGQAARIEDRGHLDLETQEILSLLKGNIEKLSDVSSRVEFMMGELSQIMKKGL